MFNKYIDTKRFKHEFLNDRVNTKEFSVKFNNKYSVPLLQSHIQLLFSSKKSFVGTKSLNLAIKFVTAATRNKKMMEIVKPHVEKILTEIVLPIMYVTEKDV